jgi:protein gp37
MSAKSSIEWTDATWTPIRARVKQDAAQIARDKGYTSLAQIAERMVGRVGPHCEHASPGCDFCYSETGNLRCLPHNGTGLPFDRRSRDLVEVFVDQDILLQPLHWRKPRMVFVCSQTDLFGEFVTDEMIDRVFAVMALCPQHTFQVLTKRAERMRAYFCQMAAEKDVQRWSNASVEIADSPCASNVVEDAGYPLPNVWLGVSVEDQQRADERIIPHLLATPAAVRWVSYEPALGPVDFTRLRPKGCSGWIDALNEREHRGPSIFDSLVGLDWVVVGGESGPGARPFDIAWARNTAAQCEAAKVPVFVKQLGANPREGSFGYYCENDPRKGGDPLDWPRDLRVRQMPEPRS